MVLLLNIWPWFQGRRKGCCRWVIGWLSRCCYRPKCRRCTMAAAFALVLVFQFFLLQRKAITSIMLCTILSKDANILVTFTYHARIYSFRQCNMLLFDLVFCKPIYLAFIGLTWGTLKSLRIDIPSRVKSEKFPDRWKILKHYECDSLSNAIWSQPK